MLKEALSVRCTVCDWSSAGRMAQIEPLAEAHARTGTPSCSACGRRRGELSD